MPAGHVNWRDVGRSVGRVGVGVLVEGVVSERGAVRGEMRRHLHLDGNGRIDHCVADDCLRVRAAGPQVGQVTL